MCSYNSATSAFKTSREPVKGRRKQDFNVTRAVPRSLTVEMCTLLLNYYEIKVGYLLILGRVRVRMQMTPPLPYHLHKNLMWIRLG